MGRGQNTLRTVSGALRKALAYANDFNTQPVRVLNNKEIVRYRIPAALPLLLHLLPETRAHPDRIDGSADRMRCFGPLRVRDFGLK